MWFFSSAAPRKPAPGRKPPHRTAAPRPAVEQLEDRCVPTLYAVTDLGTLGGDFSAGFAINNRGRVVGISDTGAVDPVNGLLSDAFAWAGGRRTDLGTLGGQFSGARSVNDRGQIVGYAQNADPDPANGAIHAVLWDRGTPHDLGTLPGTLFSDAWGVNDRGQVTGWAFTDDPEANPVTSPPNTHAFFWENGVMTELPLPPGLKNAFGGAINDRGQVAGYAADHTAAHPLFWDKQAGGFRVTDVGLPPGYLGGALRALNNRGEVAGTGRRADQVFHALAWRPDAHGHYQPIDLGGLGGAAADSLGINDRGQVVGRATTPGGSAHAFLYDATGMHDLNDLIPAGSGWLLETARGINDRGQIVGVGVHDGQFHAFLLEPAAATRPEPAGGPAPFDAGLLHGAPPTVGLVRPEGSRGDGTLRPPPRATGTDGGPQPAPAEARPVPVESRALHRPKPATAEGMTELFLGELAGQTAGDWAVLVT
jgi:probable HAF family extracellular repeat protein